MTIEQIKEEAKKRFAKDLTGEQAQAYLDAHPAGELSEEELNQVTGGYKMPLASRSSQAEELRRLRRNET